MLALGGVALWVGVDDASAASLGGAVTSVGVVTALAMLLLVKDWPSHVGSVGLPTLGGLFAFVVGACLLWRSGLVSGFRGLRRSHPRRHARLATAAAEPSQPVDLPAGIDRHALMDELLCHFLELQSAWDRGAREAMSRMTTPEMLDELCTASAAGAGTVQPTEFVSVYVELLLFEEREAAQVVCVEYSGTVRESPTASATPFREFWMSTRSAGEPGGWRLTRHQGLF